MPTTEGCAHQEASTFLRGLYSTYKLNSNLSRKEFIADCKARNLNDQELLMICNDLFRATLCNG